MGRWSFGFISTSNFVFLVIIGVLLLKVFTSSIEISRLKYQVHQLAQEIALTNKATYDKCAGRDEKDDDKCLDKNLDKTGNN